MIFQDPRKNITIPNNYNARQKKEERGERREKREEEKTGEKGKRKKRGGGCSWPVETSKERKSPRADAAPANPERPADWSAKLREEKEEARERLCLRAAADWRGCRCQGVRV